MIQLNIREKDLENEAELVKTINEILLLKVIKEENQLRIEKCFDYYRGKLPLSNYDNESKFTPQVFNVAKPITDTATKAFIGTLPDITTIGNKSEKDKISIFTQKLYNRSFSSHIYQTSKNSSICGSGFVAIYNEEGDTFPRFRELNPQFADIVYDCSLSHKRLFAFNIVENSTIDNGMLKTKYIIYVYTKKEIKVYEGSLTNYLNPSTPNAEKDLRVMPYCVFQTINKYTNEVKDTNTIEHGFNDIPIYEFPNNLEYKGDFECVMGLIQLYNDLQNNRALNVKQVVDYILMLKNVRVGNDEEQEKMVNLLKKHRLLPVEGEDVDAKYLSSPLNQTEAETLAKSIKDNIHYICRVPDLSSVDFSQNASDPILKIKTKPLLDLCCEKELCFTEPYINIIKCVLDWCSKNDKEYEKYNFDYDLISLKYAHPLPSNDLDMATQIANLYNAGVLDPTTALQEISWISNVHEYEKGVKKFYDFIDKRKQSNNNKNIVSNDTNIERQNKNPISKDMLDNQRNGAKGLGNKLSDNDIE